jgi:hypothetical protein
VIIYLSTSLKQKKLSGIFLELKFTNGNAINICLYTKREKSLDTTVSGFFYFWANIKACEMNWMGACKMPEKSHVDYLKCVLAMNENVKVEIWCGCI